MNDDGSGLSGGWVQRGDESPVSTAMDWGSTSELGGDLPDVDDDMFLDDDDLSMIDGSGLGLDSMHERRERRRSDAHRSSGVRLAPPRPPPSLPELHEMASPEKGSSPVSCE